MQPAFCFYGGRGWSPLPRPAAPLVFMQARNAPCMYMLPVPKVYNQ